MTAILVNRMIRFLAAAAAMLIFVAACGGGGGTSTGSSGGIQLTRVTGTVSGNGGAGLELQQNLHDSRGLLAELSAMILSPAFAQTVSVAGITVVVDCGAGAVYSGVTDGSGRFVIEVPNVGTGNCGSTFNGVPGPSFNVNQGTETEIKVAFDGNSVNVLNISQTADDSTSIEIDVDDDNSSDDQSDDDSLDDDSSDGDSLDDDSSDEDSADDDSSDDNGI